MNHRLRAAFARGRSSPASFLVHGLAPVPSYAFTATVQVCYLFSFTFDYGEKIAFDGKEMYWEGVGTEKDENCIHSNPSHYRRP
ncbi:hypothetical protein ARMGADRAFT_45824 [Armillaria gallica]|uniref:Uncharacterized protein n=1 Tax=Armillaria gallica TaxID=47427 RepID=A0A2H3E9W2_ARMGA|nr:hypothetical protein ARMGADRAFT_45824 [Armillaria gallica]